MNYDPLAIQPGELRHKITIEAASSTRDAAGQPVPTWNTVLTTRAKIEDTGSLSYKASFAANVLASQSTDLITIRWPGASILIEPGQRVIFESNIYIIQAVDNVLRRNRKVRLATMMIDENSN